MLGGGVHLQAQAEEYGGEVRGRQAYGVEQHVDAESRCVAAAAADAAGDVEHECDCP